MSYICHGAWYQGIILALSISTKLLSLAPTVVLTALAPLLETKKLPPHHVVNLGNVDVNFWWIFRKYRKWHRRNPCPDCILQLVQQLECYCSSQCRQLIRWFWWYTQPTNHWSIDCPPRPFEFHLRHRCSTRFLAGCCQSWRPDWKAGWICRAGTKYTAILIITTTFK